MHSLSLTWLCLVALLSPLAMAIAQTQNKDSDAQILAILQSQTEAWNRGDGEAFGAHFAEDGSFTNVVGQQTYGRPAFVAQHVHIFNTIYKGSHGSFTAGRIKYLRPDVALVDIDGVVTGAIQLPPGLKAASDGGIHVKLQEVMTKENGQWWIASFHNVAVYPLPQHP
jgi:uncharacterized protein (TIGR02246 family)